MGNRYFQSVCTWTLEELCFHIHNVILRIDTSHLKESCSHLNGPWFSFGHAVEEITFLTIMLMLTLH